MAHELEAERDQPPAWLAPSRQNKNDASCSPPICKSHEMSSEHSIIVPTRDGRTCKSRAMACVNPAVFELANHRAAAGLQATCLETQLVSLRWDLVRLERTGYRAEYSLSSATSWLARPKLVGLPPMCRT